MDTHLHAMLGAAGLSDHFMHAEVHSSILCANHYLGGRAEKMLQQHLRNTAHGHAYIAALVAWLVEKFVLLRDISHACTHARMPHTEEVYMRRFLVDLVLGIGMAPRVACNVWRQFLERYGLVSELPWVHRDLDSLPVAEFQGEELL